MAQTTEACDARIAHVRSLMAERGYDALVIRNNPDLRWLTGADATFDAETAHTALITREGLWLHTDSRYYGTLLDRLGTGTAWNVDMEQVGHAQWLAGVVSAQRVRTLAIEGSLTLAFYEEVVRALEDAGCACLMPRTHDELLDLRAVKEPDELDLMRRAQAITDAAFTHICTYIEPGLTEQQIRAELEHYMLANGAAALSFSSIIASGPNGANPHAQPSDRKVERGDMIVMDYGACYHDYHSDMTRTVCVGAPSEEETHVYDVVRQVHETCAAAIHAGVIGSEIQELSCRLIAEAGYGDYYKHGLGHGVGLEIHERPNLGRTYDKVIPEGAVVTVEPGIYLPGRFGVRLEDFGVVTSDGFEPFTASPHALTVVAK
ncbi:MAG: Xaa-Pro peptidase family protein [Atopobiaceae bacterium]|jgi:Xaa-Pro aminopeptidase|nr:Xaa-Pro peptidase family protein [Atopobiaceae bacterium]MCH4180450.1 Xaa-Pro peptidase family protein [Atopobiaceae bacterium]MCH4214595.1 Xaa-Pro peptidase family protein [Atopobiaceae bacterium]MCH4275810.1 Xaa-Pro peptidase family protein [Atopobiaceae bacterium]MCI1225826.1 Xaa-Pro peptidase family protein [Atopobiaceae bacterium]